MSDKGVARAEIARWLAAHDRQVRDAALTEAAELGTKTAMGLASALQRDGATRVAAAIRSLQEGNK